MRSNLIFQIRDYRWFAFTSFAFLFRKKKYVKETSSYSKISSGLLAYTYTCVTYTNICMPGYIYQDVVHLDSSGHPGVSSRSLGSQPSTPSVQCVCECAYKHTYTHIYSHPHKKIKKTQTTPLSFLLSKITPHAKQEVPS